jgi:hypothetical protein
MKYFKEGKNIDIDIIKEEYEILVNIHGIGYHKTTLRQDIIRDLQLLKIREVKTKTHGIKENKIIQQLAIKC